MDQPIEKITIELTGQEAKDFIWIRKHWHVLVEAQTISNGKLICHMNSNRDITKYEVHKKPELLTRRLRSV